MDCVYSGSYYDQAPWTEHACAAEYQVPEGCPIHFVTAAPFDMGQLTSAIEVANDFVITPNTATVVLTDTRTFSLPDELSCDCARSDVAIGFNQIAVDVPAAKAGDTVRVWGTGLSSGDLVVTITAPTTCPTFEMPTYYEVALACDRCPMDPSDPGDSSNDDLAGCAVGGDPSVLLVGLALVPFLRRRRAKIVSSE